MDECILKAYLNKRMRFFFRQYERAKLPYTCKRMYKWQTQETFDGSVVRKPMLHCVE